MYICQLRTFPITLLSSTCTVHSTGISISALALVKILLVNIKLNTDRKKRFEIYKTVVEITFIPKYKEDGF